MRHKWCYVVSGVTIILFIASAIGLPPDPDLPNWKGPRNNCYNYAKNQKDNDFKQPGGLPWPNVGANLTAAQWCTKVTGRAIIDGLVSLPWNPGDPIPEAPKGFNLVALGGLAGVKGGGGDYHWWRRNGDGTWSHKRGATPAKTTYTDNMGMEQTLTDPRDAAQRDGYDLCGFMGVPKQPPNPPGQDPAAPKSDEVRITEIVYSGVPDAGDYYTDGSVLGELLSRMPTCTPPVPDPEWPGVPAGQSLGFGVQPGNGVPSLPPYMRVFNGVVALYSDLDGTVITYCTDDNGLSAYLESLKPFGVGACCDREADHCAVVSETECRGFGGEYHGDGVPCAPNDTCIPATSTWGLAALILLVVCAGTVVLRRGAVAA